MVRPRLVDPDPTHAEADATDDRHEPGPRRLAAIGVAVSLALHLLLWAVVATVGEPRVAAPELDVIDLDLAPLAPEAESLPPEEELAQQQPRPAEDEPGVPEPPPEADPDGFARLADAGVVDAGVDAAVDAGVDAAVDAAVDARRARDAGADAAGDEVAASAGLDAGVDAADAGVAEAVADGGADAADAADAGVDADVDGGEPLVASAADAGVADADAGAEVATRGSDGSLVAAGTADAGVGVADGGAVATTGEADRTGVPGASSTTGTGANLLTYAPAGHVVTLLARLDRLRGTEWVDEVEALLAPLPDRGALLGNSALRITDYFETLVVSSPAPRNATATTLVARTALTPAELRGLLDQPDARVAWTPVLGGALGRRMPSPRLLPGDSRVFLGWKPGWTTLAQRVDLGGLLAPSSVGLDLAAAPSDRLPAWLARVEGIEAEAGDADGPALMVTAAGMFPARVELPMVDGGVPGPQRATLTLTMEGGGFVVRGSLRYADEAAAATAADALVRAQRELSDSLTAKLALRGLRAWNAVRGLTVKRTGSRVAFSTSISAGDARVLLARLADLLRAHFDDLPGGRPVPVPAPDAGVP